MTKIGVGESQEREPFQAGARAAQAALMSGDMAKCDFALMFATVGYNQDKLMRGVRSVIGPAPLSGCSGAGIITQSGPQGEVMFTLSGSATETETVGIMAFSSDEIAFHNCAAEGLKADSLSAGRALGETLAAARPNNPRLLLLFPDAYTVNVNELFKGLESALARPLPFAGGLSGHNLPMSDLTYQYHNDRVMTDAVSGVLISGRAEIDVGVNHGCLPISTEKTITRANANTVFEIDGRPAWDFFKQYLEDDADELTTENATFLSVGESLPEQLSTEYDRYIIRAPVKKNADGSIVFATKIAEGARVRMMRRDEDRISQGAARLAERLRTARRDRPPSAILHFDCAARGKMFFGDKVKEKEIDVIQDVFGKDIPWLGLFCFGEIAPIRGINHYHNQTVVLCTLYL